MRYVIWDWNGTLFDDVDSCIYSMNRLLERYGLPLLKDADEYRSKFSFPVIGYYENVGFDFDKTPFEQLAVEFLEIYHKAGKQCPLTRGIEAVLTELKDRGYRQIILSASKRNHLLDQVNQFEISSYFEEIIGLSDIYAVSKVDAARDWLSDRDTESITMIGDTYHDLEVANQLGADCILYTQGHQPITKSTDGRYTVVGNIMEVLDLLK